jgi:hypothetical protein
MATSVITRPVATIANAVTGSYPRPSASITATVMTKAVRTA